MLRTKPVLFVLCILFLFPASLVTGCFHPDSSVQKYDDRQTLVKFLDREAAFRYLKNAGFSERMNNFNISLRIDRDPGDTARTAELRLYNNFVYDNLKNWDSYEKAVVLKALASAIQKFKHFSTAVLPDTLCLINTGLRLEFNSFFTVDKAICIPSTVTWPFFFDGIIEEKLIHEIFHIYTRFHEKERDSLYALFNIYRADSIITGVYLSSKTINNPDVHSGNYYFRLADSSGVQQNILTAVCLNEEKYKNNRGIISFLGVTNIFGYFNNNFYALEETAPRRFNVINKENPVKLNPAFYLASLDTVCGCFTRNRYFPEEITAEALVSAMKFNLAQKFAGGCSLADKQKFTKIMNIIRQNKLTAAGKL